MTKNWFDYNVPMVDKVWFWGIYEGTEFKDFSILGNNNCPGHCSDNVECWICSISTVLWILRIGRLADDHFRNRKL